MTTAELECAAAKECAEHQARNAEAMFVEVAKRESTRCHECTMWPGCDEGCRTRGVLPVMDALALDNNDLAAINRATDGALMRAFEEFIDDDYGIDVQVGKEGTPEYVVVLTILRGDVVVASEHYPIKRWRALSEFERLVLLDRYTADLLARSKRLERRFAPKMAAAREARAPR